MSQHDYAIANGTGLAVRTDINALADAIATHNGGASAPSVTFAHMLWYDETNNLMKVRNAANSAWLAFSTLIEASGITTSQILDANVTLAKLANIATDSLIGRDTASSGVPEVIGVTGGIEFTGSGSIRTGAFTGDVTKTAGGTALSIASNAVTLAMMAQIATNSFLGRVTASTGNVEVLSAANAKTILALVKGDVGLGNVDNTSNATERAATATLTNKRVTPRIGTTASSATPQFDADSHDQYNVTAAAAGMTWSAPAGTPTDGQKMLVRIKDNGTARSIAWNAIFRAVGVTLPTTTVISKTLYVGFVYNSADTKWDCIATAQEA